MQFLQDFQKVFSAYNEEDENLALLKALKPHIHSERISRVDEMIRMYHIMKVLPVLRETQLFSGLSKLPFLSGLFGGGDNET